MFLCDFAAPSFPPCPGSVCTVGQRLRVLPSSALEKFSYADPREIISNSHQSQWKQAQDLQRVKPEVKLKTLLWGFIQEG